MYWGKYMKIKGFYIVKDKDYHNLLDTFLYYSNIDIVNFLTKYDTSAKSIKFDASLLAKEFVVF